MRQARSPNLGISKEIAQFDTFKASQFYSSRQLKPVRTELCVGWRTNGQSISAGQIDALYVDKDGLYYLLDFKRVAKHHKLCPKDKGFAVRGEAPPVGVGPMAHLRPTPTSRSTRCRRPCHELVFIRYYDDTTYE